MKKMNLLLSCLFLLVSLNLSAQLPSPFNSILGTIPNELTQKVLSNPSTYRYQLVYTQINRDKKGQPHFTNYNLQKNKINQVRFYDPIELELKNDIIMWYMNTS